MHNKRSGGVILRIPWASQFYILGLIEDNRFTRERTLLEKIYSSHAPGHQRLRKEGKIEFLFYSTAKAHVTSLLIPNFIGRVELRINQTVLKIKSETKYETEKKKKKNTAPDFHFIPRCDCIFF